MKISLLGRLTPQTNKIQLSYRLPLKRKISQVLSLSIIPTKMLMKFMIMHQHKGWKRLAEVIFGDFQTNFSVRMRSKESKHLAKWAKNCNADSISFICTLGTRKIVVITQIAGWLSILQPTLKAPKLLLQTLMIHPSLKLMTATYPSLRLLDISK